MNSLITDYYANKNLLVTGSTGCYKFYFLNNLFELC